MALSFLDVEPNPAVLIFVWEGLIEQPVDRIVRSHGAPRSTSRAAALPASAQNQTLGSSQPASIATVVLPLPA